MIFRSTIVFGHACQAGGFALLDLSLLPRHLAFLNNGEYVLRPLGSVRFIFLNRIESNMPVLKFGVDET
jgi:hypothetical protein